MRREHLGAMTPETFSKLQKVDDAYVAEVEKIVGRKIDLTTIVHVAHGPGEQCTGAYLSTTETSSEGVYNSLMRGLATLGAITSRQEVQGDSNAVH